MFLETIEYPRLLFLFLSAATGQVFLGTEKENLLSFSFWREGIGAKYNNKLGELILLPFKSMPGNSFLGILLFLGSIFEIWF